jgi:hypothetical protein
MREDLIGALKGHAKSPRLKPLLFWPLFHGLKAVASTVASLREASGADISAETRAQLG